MLRFKQFCGTVNDLEGQINTWLSASDPDVTQMSQVLLGDGGVAISFLYEESFRGQELRLAEERGFSMKDTGTERPESIKDRPIRVPEEPGMIDSELQRQQTP